MIIREQEEQKKKKTIPYFDYSLLIIIFFLVCFGLVMLYSTSAYTALNTRSDAAYYVKRQGLFAIMGFAAMLVCARVIKYKYYKSFAPVIYLVAIFLCAIVNVVGKEINGAKRWLSIGDVIQFQPSEFAKIGVIFLLALMISQAPKQVMTRDGFIKFAIAALLPAFFVAINNMSTAIIIAGIGIGMIFVAYPRYREFFIVLLGLFVLGVLGVLLQGYRSHRFRVWLNPESYDEGYQTLQGLYAIGSGGLFGKGLGESLQKLGNVPEAQNDMIFTIICEELGLFGAICIMLLFLLLLWRCLVIANNAPDLFGSMLVTGVMIHIAMQVVLNIAVVTNSIPNTGVTLPFISYGGTSLSILLAEMGFVLGVSRQIEFEA